MTRKLISYKDVALTFLQGGVPALTLLHSTGNLSRATVLRAVKSLKLSGQDTKYLESWAHTVFRNFGRGKQAPTPGTQRNYRVQAIPTTGPFIRLPVDTFGVEKGSELKVRFEENRIIITKVTQQESGSTLSQLDTDIKNLNSSFRLRRRIVEGSSHE